MIKATLVDQLIEKVNLSRADAILAVQTILNSITVSLQQGHKVELRGFGSFKIRERKPRLGRNPKTGERVAVTARKVAYFKPGRELSKRLNPKSS